MYGVAECGRGKNHEGRGACVRVALAFGEHGAVYVQRVALKLHIRALAFHVSQWITTHLWLGMCP